MGHDQNTWDSPTSSGERMVAAARAAKAREDEGSAFTRWAMYVSTNDEAILEDANPDELRAMMKIAGRATRRRDDLIQELRVGYMGVAPDRQSPVVDQSLPKKAKRRFAIGIDIPEGDIYILAIEAEWLAVEDGKMVLSVGSTAVCVVPVDRLVFANDLSVDLSGRSWDGFWEEWREWAGEAIPDYTQTTLVTKFREEMQEFLDEPSAEEAMDCIAILMYWCIRSGEDALQAAYDKLEVCRNRTWERMEDGTYHHVK